MIEWKVGPLFPGYHLQHGCANAKQLLRQAPHLALADVVAVTEGARHALAQAGATAAVAERTCQ
jgi:hypothetical protein